MHISGIDKPTALGDLFSMRGATYRVVKVHLCSADAENLTNPGAPYRRVPLSEIRARRISPVTIADSLANRVFNLRKVKGENMLVDRAQLKRLLQDAVEAAVREGVR